MVTDTKQPENMTVLDSLTSWKAFLVYLKGKINHPGVNKHSKNISWMFVMKIASMGISFLATIYIARHLGPTNYGQLNYAVSFVGLFSFIAALGIDQVLARDLVKYPEKRNEYMGSAVVLRTVSSILSIILCMFFAFALSARDVSILLIFIVSLTFLFTTFQLIGYEFQADVDQKYPSILSFLVVLVLNILQILVIVFGKGVIYLALILLLESILYASGYIYLRTRTYGTIRYWRFDKKIAFSIFKDSSPLILAAAFASIYGRIDQVMIKNMMSAASVGLYSSAVSVSEVWYFIPQIIMSGLFPAIVNARKTSEKLYSERIKKMFLLLFTLSVLAALGTTIFSRFLIGVIFGAGFIAASSVLQIYVWSNIGSVLNALTQQILVTENLTGIISASTFFGMATNVILNIFWIPRYGMAGAAFASLISYLVPCFSLLFFKRTRKIILRMI